MKSSINQIYIENLNLLENCFKDNPLNPLLRGIIQGLKNRLDYYEELLAPFEGQDVNPEDIIEAASILAEDLRKVKDNYNALLKRHAILTRENEEMYNELQNFKNIQNG